MKSFIQSSIFTFIFCTALVGCGLIFGPATVTFAQGKSKTASSKSSEPRTVLDFYKILPAKYFSYLEYEPIKRMSLIGTSSVAQGYLNFDNNRPIQPANAQILLLKRTSGAPLLVISFTDCDADPCRASLRFVEYKAGDWTEVKAAAAIPDRQKINEIYRRKTGRAISDKAFLIYDISPIDKSISVQLSSEGEKAKIYKLKWDGNIYDYAAPLK